MIDHFSSLRLAPPSPPSFQSLSINSISSLNFLTHR
jgi:hypothetical protein